MNPAITAAITLCPELSTFDPADLTAVVRAFGLAPALVMNQPWRAEIEYDFAPATVWTGWRQETLFVFAELTDADVSTQATGPNQRLWELGDVFEVFLRPEHQIAYAELQVAPNNQRLQLRYASAEALEHARRTNSLDEALLPIAFHSRVWLRPDMRRWYVLAEIPAAAICDHPGELAGSTWQVSFCRYDYTRGRSEPVISSTSPLTRPDFHRQAEWGTLIFQPAA